MRNNLKDFFEPFHFSCIIVGLSSCFWSSCRILCLIYNYQTHAISCVSFPSPIRSVSLNIKSVGIDLGLIFATRWLSSPVLSRWINIYFYLTFTKMDRRLSAFVSPFSFHFRNSSTMIFEHSFASILYTFRRCWFTLGTLMVALASLFGYCCLICSFDLGTKTDTFPNPFWNGWFDWFIGLFWHPSGSMFRGHGFLRHWCTRHRGHNAEE